MEIAATTGDEEALIKCGTTAGDFTMHMYREWSPNGYDKAVMLFEKGYYDTTHFFRVVPKFLVQFGITYQKDLAPLGRKRIKDDPQLNPKIPFEPGTMAFAGGGTDSRTSQLFISYGFNEGLGASLWETPIGKVVEGYEETVEKFYSYGDQPPWGKGPDQPRIHDGPEYLEKEFPLLDRFKKCQVHRIKPEAEPAVHNEQQVMEKEVAEELVEDIEIDLETDAAKEDAPPHLRATPHNTSAFHSFRAPVAALVILAVVIVLGRLIHKNSQEKDRKSS